MSAASRDDGPASPPFSRATIAADARRFEAAAFSIAEMDHARHVAVALHYLDRFDEAAATARMKRGLRAFLAAHGRAEGYNETITAYFMRVLARLTRELADRPLEERVAIALRGEGAMAALRARYSQERLASDEARDRALDPDLT